MRTSPEPAAPHPRERPGLLAGALQGMGVALAATAGLGALMAVLPHGLEADLVVGLFLLTSPLVSVVGVVAGLGVAMIRRNERAYEERHVPVGAAPGVPWQVAVAGVLLGLTGAGVLIPDVPGAMGFIVALVLQPIAGAAGWALLRRVWLEPGELLTRRRLSGVAGATLLGTFGIYAAALATRDRSMALLLAAAIAAVGCAMGIARYDAHVSRRAPLPAGDGASIPPRTADR